ncbi:MAG: hypothetical protein A3F26_03330 [Candidatus Ryanbacteria bacterium RIFCSPHIGHO2_12_FULL_47_12b]|uniref:Lipid II flippase MurJ n=2 Tax=Candidatus Ryaniibacteriota TaxID=1817914 RepID=A0A1G2H2A3_9BACT|nr:MAG: Integral membrane protein MviN [Parcubacteria group bacterium GW2011_GWA2_47_10b]OGZ46279.1 MAG: hypothetical protein A2844_02070 [Candidatus Ryanbacteria bacterium RIFCSPHIGHO2_01_FULL_48_80]OGZ50185.1 MAG: hypothetical protein A3C83_01955 [Candidatus Ryanbacteria bacterium RIFCSPHIGHO2_02_FULL_47_25]OGZ51539.1 MAG: hypothetical protein A3F26_03330 [Candidatus Ryanbacteria bacterium RIFCSPHIGHO2_12_FULL_47_12b]OGZ52814.1 MAG: hypothetical protein A3A29_00895 [Candidatus Ryanbacteria ba
MVLSRFFRLESTGIHQAAFLLALSSIANTVFALFRDRLLAGSFGASRVLDIYYAAFRLPDMLFSLSLFFVASTAFIPLYLEYQGKSPESARRFFGSVITLFLGAIVVLLCIAFLALPVLIPRIVPGFSKEEQETTRLLSSIMLFSPLFLGLSSIVSGVVQSSKRFLSYALAPIAYNGGIILGVLVFLPVFGASGLALGVVMGAFFHLVVQIPTLIRLRVFPRARFTLDSESLQIIWYSFPRAAALSVNQLTLMVLTALASTLGAGSIAIFNLSQNLYALPLTVIGLSYSVAAFPTMAELAIKKDRLLFFQHLVSATRHVLFWTIPITGLFFVFRAHIVRLVLGTGAFAWVDTHLTIASLFLFSFAIMAQSLVTLFVRAFYALGKTREPILFNIISAVATIFLAFGVVSIIQKNVASEAFFAAVFRVRLENVSGAGVAFLGLPLAFSFGALLNALLLGMSLFSMNGKETARAVYRSGGKITLAATGMSLAAYATRQALGPYFPLDTVAQVVIHASLSLGVALLVGYYLLRWLEVREFFELRDAIHARFKKREVLQPEVERL